MTAEAVVAAFLVSVLLAAGIYDVVALAWKVPTISSALRSWGDKDPLLSLACFFLLWHLFVQR